MAWPLNPEELAKRDAQRASERAARRWCVWRKPLTDTPSPAQLAQPGDKLIMPDKQPFKHFELLAGPFDTEAEAEDWLAANP